MASQLARGGLVGTLIVAVILVVPGLASANTWYNSSFYCGLSSSFTASTVAEGSTVTHRVTYCQAYTGYSNAATYQADPLASGTRVDTASPQHLNNGQSGTFSMSFSAGSPGVKDYTTYLVASNSVPGPSLYNAWGHNVLTVVGNPTTPSLSLSPAASVWSTDTTPTWSWTASTAASGSIDHYEVDPTWLGTVSQAARTYTPTLGSGQWGVRVRAVNNVGAASAYTGTLTAFIDVTAPSTTATPSGTLGSNGWYRGAVTVALAATDAHSGVAATYRSLDGAAFAQGTSISVSTQGTHTVRYYSVDNAGNTEATRTLNVNIDSVTPATTLGVSAPVVVQGGASYVNAASRVTLAASDAASGVASTTYTVNGGAATSYAAPFGFTGADGSRALSYSSTDVAGNAEAARSASFFLDNTPPVSTLNVGTPSYNVGGSTYIGPQTPLSLDASDAGVGLGPAQYRVDGGAWATSTGATFSVSGSDGSHVVQTSATDLLGNAEAPKSRTFLVDATVPDATLSDPAPNTMSASGTTQPLQACSTSAPCDGRAYIVGGSQVTLRALASDPTVGGVSSGLDWVAFVLDTKAIAILTSGPFQVTWDTSNEGAGDHNLRVLAVDKVGNYRYVDRKVTIVPATQSGAGSTVGGISESVDRTVGPILGNPVGVLNQTTGGLLGQILALAGGGPLPPVQIPEVPGVPTVPNVSPVTTIVVDPNTRSVDWRLGAEVDGQFVGDQRAVHG